MTFMFASRVVRRATTLAFAAGLALPAAAAAQQQSSLSSLSLEELMRLEVEPVFGASRRLQPVTEAPASITIVTAEDIRLFGYRTLADILRSARGLYVTWDRNYHYAGVRGFSVPGDYSTRVLLLVNGHRMNDNVYDQASIGPDFGLDVSTFERVEIIRGPASALYGTNAFFGVVNVITKKGASVDGLSVEADGGTLGTASLRSSFGRKLDNGVAFLVSATGSRTSGEGQIYFPAYDDPSTNFGVAEGMDGSRFGQFYSQVSTRRFTFTGAYGRRIRHVPTAAFGTLFNDDRFTTDDERGFVDGQYDRAFGRVRLNLRGYLDHYEYRGHYPYESVTLDDPTYVQLDGGVGRWWGGEARATSEINDQHAITAGVEFRRNRQQRQWVIDADDPGADFDQRANSHVFAAYAQDEIKVVDRLRLHLGARVDSYADTSRVTPRAAVIFNRSANEAVKLLYGQAFRAPNAYERDYYSPNRDSDTPLTPESVRTFEIV
ncbi:MAG TPA: TonB-dependent receptor, partial [Vicinamibacterales bacterium]|nr:TonB-dependent receptor [Vicinamibacterales bacterium]